MRNTTAYKPILTLAAMLLLLSSCGIKLKGARRGDNASVETFLVENGIIQYFVKPLTFSSRSGDIRIDFTFRGKNDSLYKAKINFTTSDKEAGKIDSFKVIDNTTNEAVSTAYNTRMGKVTKGLRYFSEVTNNPLFNLFESGHSLTIVTYSKGNTIVYSPSKKSEKKIKRIPQTLISD